MNAQTTLESQVNKLKNLVFFRLVVYFFIIAALSWLILIFMNESTVFTSRIAKAEHALKEVSDKLFYANNFRSGILSTYQKYKDPQSPALQPNYVYLIKNFENLSTDPTFLENINATISKPFLRKFDEIINNNQIVMRNHNIYLSFATASFNDFLLNLKKIHEILPENSLITSAEAEQQEAITPEFIARLNAKKGPNIVKAKVSIMIRNIGLLTE